MFFYLLVLEFENLKTVWVSCLSGLRFCKVVNYALVWVSLFNVFICEVDNHVAVWIGFSSHTVSKDYFFFTRLINALNLTIVTNYLIHNLWIFTRFSVILVEILQAVVLLLLIGYLLVVCIQYLISVVRINSILLLFSNFLLSLPLRLGSWFSRLLNYWLRLLYLSTEGVSVVLNSLISILLWLLSVLLRRSLISQRLLRLWCLLSLLLFWHMHLHFVKFFLQLLVFLL